jgi:hypothetical protein
MVLGLENEEDGDGTRCEREVERDPEGGGGTGWGRETKGSSAKEPLQRLEHAPTHNHTLLILSRLLGGNLREEDGLEGHLTQVKPLAPPFFLLKVRVHMLCYVTVLGLDMMATRYPDSLFRS